MNALKHVILVPFCLGLVVMDLAVVLLVIRLLGRTFSWKPLLALGHIVGPAVDVVTGAMWHHLKRWTTVALSEPQQEAVVLLVLLITRWFFGAVLAAVP